MLSRFQCKPSLLSGVALVCMLAAVGCPGSSSPAAMGTAGTGAAMPAAGGGAGNGAVGGGGGTAAANGGTGAAGSGSSGPAATFTAVYAMMFPMATNARCNACHANPANDITNGNLYMGMDQATAYGAIVGKPAAGSLCVPRMLVVPGQPEMSLFLQKLAPTPPCGVRMPNGGKQFTDAQIEMVRSWIAAGAKND